MNAMTLQTRKAALAAFGSLALLGAVASIPAKAAEVGVSIGISQPGVYGRIDIGRFPQPQVVIQQPVYVYQPAPVVQYPGYGYRPAPVVEPVYMWVPPGHRKNWRKHCAAYRACGAPVYFVQDRWYHDHVAPPRGSSGHYDRGQDRGADNGHGQGKDKHKGKDRDRD